MTGILVLALFSFVLLIPYAFIGIALGRYSFHRQPDLSCRHSEDLLDGHTFKVSQSTWVDGKSIRLSGGRNCDCVLFATWIGVFWPLTLAAVAAARMGHFSYKRIGMPFVGAALHVGDIAAEKKQKTEMVALYRANPQKLEELEAEAFAPFVVDRRSTPF